MSATCSLSERQLSRRLAWIRDEILPHARRSERFADGIAWELEDAPGLAEKLDRWIALERECCSSVTFARRDGAQPGWIRLEVRGIDPDALPAPVGDGGVLRLATVAGLGVAAACVACCTFPLTAWAILGGAAAGVALIEPAWAIGFAALAVGAAAWWWRMRRAACSSHRSAASSASS
jgi:hypothetical protein